MIQLGQGLSLPHHRSTSFWDAFTSKATGNWNAVGETTWNEEGYPQSGDGVTIQNTHVVTLVGNEVCSTIAVNAGGGLDIATFNLICGVLSLSGDLTIGVSADQGLVPKGLSLASGSTADLQQTSIINNAGNYAADNSSIFTTNLRGMYIQTHNGSFESIHWDNQFYDFTINDGITLTIAGGSRIGSNFSNDLTINGILNCGVNWVGSGAGSSGSINIGANGDIIGTSLMDMLVSASATVSFNRTSALSFAGTVNHISNAATGLILSFDWSNASVVINGTTTGRTYTLSQGALKCVDLYLYNDSNGALAIDNTVNDVDMEISGDIGLNIGAGSYTTTWTKSPTATLKLTGSNQSIDLNAQDVETIYSDIDIGDVTILASDTWDIGTLNLFTSALTVNGVLTIDESVDTGLTCSSLTMAASATKDWDQEAIFNCSGNIDLPSTDISPTNRTGVYTQTGNGTYSCLSTNNCFRRATINSAVTLTLANAFSTLIWSGKEVIFNGVLACGVHDLKIGFYGGEIFSIGLNGDITGSGIITLETQGSNIATVTYSRLTPLSFAGTISIEGSLGTLTIPSFRFDNADVELVETAVSIYTFSTGDFGAKDFTITNSGTNTISVDNSVNDTDITIGGNIDLNAGAGTYTTVWSRSTTATMTLTGSSGTQTCNFDAQSIENLIINASGAIKQLTGNVTPLEFIGTAGTLDVNGYYFYLRDNTTIEDAFDITGSGASRIVCYLVDGTHTFTYNKTSALTFSGLLESVTSSNTRLLPILNLSNANYAIGSNTTSDRYSVFDSGTLKCIDLYFERSTASGTLFVDASANNPSIEVSGDVDFHYAGTTWTLDYDRGTGTYTLSGGNANIDFDSQTIERLIVSGTTKTLIDSFTTASMLVSGILDLNSIGTVTVEGDLDGAGTISSPTPVNLTVSGSNNFTGTLTNVTIV